MLTNVEVIKHNRKLEKASHPVLSCYRNSCVSGFKKVREETTVSYIAHCIRKTNVVDWCRFKLTNFLLC